MIQKNKKRFKAINSKTIFGTVSMLFFGSTSIFAQAADTAEAKKVPDVFYDTTFAYTLVGVAALLACVIYILGSVFLMAIKNRIAEEKRNGTFTKAGIMIGLLLTAVATANAQSPVPAGAKTVVSENVMYIIASVIVLELLLIFYLAIGIRTFLNKESAAVVEKQAEELKKEKIPWFDRIYNRNTDADIIKLDLGHDYDGIKELDNDIPIWWKYGFGFCILFGIVYLYSYHIAESRPLQQKELQIDQEIAAVKQAAYLEKSANNVDEKTVKMLGLSDIEAGKALFIKPGACATCHAENGSAIVNGAPGIGPNLTDEYWIHKGDIKSIFTTIKYGWPEKGMKSWKDDYSPLQIAQLASYVKSLQGTNPSPAKEKQGELFKDETVPSVAVDSASKAVKM
ncbi:MAG: cbb3-type cytochrome c oxidase N-terminal domain-containing protein [Sphingobacteriia bacterium]